MHRALPLDIADYVGPLVGGLVFILVMSLVKEPARRTFNAIFVAGAMGAYIAGGLGLLELPFAAVGSFVAYRGLRSYRFVGVAWLMHSTWDLVHHFYGNTIWPFMERSSFGCCIFDAVIAAWFIAGAPSVVGALGRGPSGELRIDGSEDAVLRQGLAQAARQNVAPGDRRGPP
jgi:hypothetical protein